MRKNTIRFFIIKKIIISFCWNLLEAAKRGPFSSPSPCNGISNPDEFFFKTCPFTIHFKSSLKPERKSQTKKKISLLSVVESCCFDFFFLERYRSFSLRAFTGKGATTDWMMNQIKMHSCHRQLGRDRRSLTEQKMLTVDLSLSSQIGVLFIFT